MSIASVDSIPNLYVVRSFWGQQDHYVFQYSKLCVQVTISTQCHQLQRASMLWHVFHNIVSDIVVVGSMPAHL